MTDRRRARPPPERPKAFALRAAPCHTSATIIARASRQSARAGEAMADQGVKLFLSCVSDEFGAYRDALRRALTRPNVEVKIQEDFKALGGDTLSMLEEYIEHCDAVVHFVGEMTGSAPQRFRRRGPARAPPGLEDQAAAARGRARCAARAISYTQWEAWLALCFRQGPGHRRARGKASSAARTSRPTDDSRAAQAAHLARLRAIDRYPGRRHSPTTTISSRKSSHRR